VTRDIAGPHIAIRIQVKPPPPRSGAGEEEECHGHRTDGVLSAFECSGFAEDSVEHFLFVGAVAERRSTEPRTSSTGSASKYGPGSRTKSPMTTEWTCSGEYLRMP
jgi:hypothetical protein